MTERTYRCNFCRDEIKNGEQGFGLYWSGNGTGDDVIAVKMLTSCENHLCCKCCRAIRAIAAGDLPIQAKEWPK